MNNGKKERQVFKKNKNLIWGLLLPIALFFLIPTQVKAQPGMDPRAESRDMIRSGDYESALPILKKLYEDAPFDKDVYRDYLTSLIQTKHYDGADSLVHYMINILRDDPAMYVDLGKVALASGKKKPAKKYFDQALDNLPKDDFGIQALADAFNNAGQTDMAIQVYLKARTQANNPYVFASQLALLYKKNGDVKGAINALLDKAMTQVGIINDLQESLLQIIDDEKEGIKEVQKAINARLKANPQNPAWQQLLSWTYTQNGDYEGALKNLETLDKEFNEDGMRLIPFGSDALKANQFLIAQKAFEYVIQQGEDKSYFQLAQAGLIQTNLNKVEAQYPPTPTDVQKLISDYKAFFERYPNFKNSDTWRDYARVEARYNGQPDTAIALLQSVAGDQGAMNKFMGWCRLDMADYCLLAGKKWEATLLYSQVNQAFTQDELGELARFKNAKWAFYTGDFNLAQDQLSVLKASTSQLISNDAIYLSVLITENVPKDSNMVPLKRYAAADLLLFQNKTKDADQLLDSISKAWPESPLQDDIIMLRGQTAAAEGDWNRAIVYYEDVLEHYGDDVLGDDAAWQLAETYRLHLKDDKKALEYYKELIVKYPGSTYIQEARKWYRQLSDSKEQPET